MALRQLLNRSCNSPDAVFRTIRDFLSAVNGIDDFTAGGDNPGPGYEIVDESYASGDSTSTTADDWCVMRSPGEFGPWPHYVRLGFGTLRHDINAYLAWDSDAHTGMGGTGRTTNINHNGAGEVILYIYADLDEIHIVILPRGGSNWYWHPCGRIKPYMTFYSSDAVQVAEAITGGVDATVILPTWPAWAKVGGKIYLWDDLSLSEAEIVAADAAAQTITLSGQVGKRAGSWLAEDLLLFAGSSYNTSAGANNNLYGLPGRGGGSTVAMTAQLPSFPGIDDKYSIRYGCDIWVTQVPGSGGAGANGIRGRLANVRLTQAEPAGHGETWTDDEGNNWRLHTVYNKAVLAFREAD